MKTFVFVFFFSLLLQAEDRIQIKSTWAGLKDAHLSGQLDDQVGPVGNPYNLVSLLQWENGEKVAPAEFNSHSEEFWYLARSAKADGKAAHEFLLAASGSSSAPAPALAVASPAQTEKKVLVTEDPSLKLKIQNQNNTIITQEAQLTDARKQLETIRTELNVAKNQVSELEAKVASMNESTIADTRDLVAKVVALEKENVELRRQLDSAKAAAEHTADVKNGNADLPVEKIRNGLIAILIIFSLICAVYYLTSLPQRLAKILKRDRQNKTPKPAAIKKAPKAPAPSKEVSVSQLISLDEAVKHIALETVGEKAFIGLQEGDGGSVEVCVMTSHAQAAVYEILQSRFFNTHVVSKYHTGSETRGTATYIVGIVPRPARANILAVGKA